MCAEPALACATQLMLSAMGDAESGAGTTPVLGRVAVGICAAAVLTIVGVLTADAASSSTAAVQTATAPPSGPLGLLAFGLGASVILGLIVAVNSLTAPDPVYGKNLFRRNDLRGLGEAAPAMPLLGISFVIYWLGFSGVTWFGWRRDEPASATAQVSADLALVGAAGLALWMILVALGKRSRPAAGSGA